MKRTGQEVLINVEDFAHMLYDTACRQERSGLVGGMLTTIQLETPDAKQLANDIADVIFSLKKLIMEINK